MWVIIDLMNNENLQLLLDQVEVAQASDDLAIFVTTAIPNCILIRQNAKDKAMQQFPMLDRFEAQQVPKPSAVEFELGYKLIYGTYQYW